MRAQRRPIQAILSRLLVALLIVVGFQATSFTQTSPAVASATAITDDGSNSSGWTGDVSLDGTGGNLGSAFTFSKNTLMGKEFGTSGDDFSGATIEFQAKFVDGKDHIALFWGDGVNQTASITNSLYLGPGGNPASGAAMAGKIGISGGHVSPHIYWHGVDGGVSGTGSASVTSGLWQTNRWYVIKVAIGASSTTYYVDGVLIQTKATSLPTANVITLGGDDRNGWGFSNGVFVDNISITPGGAVPAGSTGSLYLNNTSLSHAFNNNLDVGTGQFTMEMWVKPVGNKGQPLWGSNLTGTYNIGADTGLGSSCAANTRLLIARQAQACPYLTPVGSFSTETTWRHVVWQRGASNAMAVYINGVRQLAITESADFGLKTGPLKIGWSERAAFTGYITNVRLVKGAGLYSGTTITPPTEPLTRNVSAGTTTFLLGTASSSTALRDSVSNFIMTADGTSNFDSTVAATPLGGLTWSSETPFAPPLAVNYDLNLGSGSAPTASVQPGASFTTAAAPTRSGYTFTVWRSGVSDTPASTSFTANRSYIMGSTDITLTAQWLPLANTVTFNSQNGVPGTTNQTYSGSVSSNPTEPTWTGHDFMGWSETTDGVVVDLSTITITEAKTFYAIWDLKTYVVTFNPENEQSATTEQVNHGSPPSLPTEPNRNAYDFIGWSETSDGVVVDLSTITITEAKTFYAIWDLKTYVVTFNPQNLQSATTEKVNHGSAPSLPTEPSWDGYEFIGWSETSDGLVVDLSTITITAAKTFYSIWDLKAYEVNFNSQNWQSATTEQVNHGSAPNLPTEPSWYGYNFEGWSETSTGTVVDLSTITITDAKTFYAIWEQKSLAGLFNLSSPNILNPHPTQDQSVTSSLGTTSTSVKVPAGALPSSFQVKVYTLPDDSFANAKLGAGTYIISQVVAWSDTAVGSVGNIQDTAAGKPIQMTITSPDIKVGAKVYAVLGNSSTLLRTATHNGSVTVTFSEDPVIIVEAAPYAYTPPRESRLDYVSIKPVVKPNKPLARTPKAVNFAEFNPNSWAITKSIKSAIDKFFRKIATPTKVTCVGNTMGPKVLKGYLEIAERRAGVVCAYISSKFAQTAEVVISGVPTKFTETRYRRTKVGLSY